MTLLNIDNIEIDDEYIGAYKVSYNKIDGEGTKRNLNGDMRRQVIANKIKIEISTIENLPSEVMKNILELVTRDTVTCKFYNPKVKNYSTVKAYLNTPEPVLYAKINGDYRYKAMAFNIIEL